MTVRPRGRKRTLSKHVSSFNMWMDQVYQVRAIMEATGALKDAPVIRELLDEALSARRRKALGITDSEEPPGQDAPTQKNPGCWILHALWVLCFTTGVFPIRFRLPNVKRLS